MSLKTFHIVFIAAVLIFCVAFGAWGVSDFLTRGRRESLVMGVLTLAAAPALVWYAAWFLRKLRNVGYL